MISRARLFGLLGGLCLGACASASVAPAPSSQSYADHLVGRLANLRQDHEAAADRYFSALARDPGNETLLEGAASASLAAGDIDGARRAARIAPRDGAPPTIELIRAADALAGGRAQQAGAALDRVAGRSSQGLMVRVMRVWTESGAGVDRAIADLAPYSAIRPYGALFAYQQALAFDFAGRNEEALSRYAEASVGGMFLPPAIERHADLLARTGAREDARALLTTEANRSNPALLAAAARSSNGGALASATLTPARGAAIGLYGLAALFAEENDPATALEALTLSLMLDPQFDAARLLFAQTQADQQQPDIANRALARVPPTSPYAASARVQQAWILFDAGREEEALTLVQSAVAGGDLRARRTLADMYRNQRRFSEAEAIYSDMIADQPSEWRLYFARGAARDQLDRWPEAEADFRRALELSPEQPDVMNYLAYTWVDRGENIDQALPMLRRAVELRPASGAIVDSLGWAYYRLGDYNQALLYLERAVELRPADAILNDHLGDVYWRLGRRIEARFQWRRALTLEPENPAALQAKIDNGLEEAPSPARSANR
ncbi:MAG: tetratricopeptide repeat protein [Hyphomonadaceae bacterium]|nr:tetratricopeptide repeat protein [Hyphomonadaceae bacterium]